MMCKPWTPSATAINLIKQFEAFAATLYRDQRDIWTIGYGHKIGSILPQDCPYTGGITADQAMVLLGGDMALCTRIVNRFVYVKLAQPMFDALVSLVYNIGGGNFFSSTLMKCLNQSDYHNAADQFLVWDHVDHQVSHGLMVRRGAEHDLFLSGVAP